MPRPRNPENEAGRKAQERYRAKLKRMKKPEVDAVDTAVAVAVAVYADGARTLQSERDTQMVEGIEALAINFLVSRGASPEHAKRKVIARLRRLDVEQLKPSVKPQKTSAA